MLHERNERTNKQTKTRLSTRTQYLRGGEFGPLWKQQSHARPYNERRRMALFIGTQCDSFAPSPCSSFSVNINHTELTTVSAAKLPRRLYSVSIHPRHMKHTSNDSVTVRVGADSNASEYNDVSVNDVVHIRRWSQKIILYYIILHYITLYYIIL